MLYFEATICFLNYKLITNNTCNHILHMGVIRSYSCNSVGIAPVAYRNPHSMQHTAETYPLPVPYRTHYCLSPPAVFHPDYHWSPIFCSMHVDVPEEVDGSVGDAVASAAAVAAGAGVPIGGGHGEAVAVSVNEPKHDSDGGGEAVADDGRSARLQQWTIDLTCHRPKKRRSERTERMQLSMLVPKQTTNAISRQSSTMQNDC